MTTLYHPLTDRAMRAVDNLKTRANEYLTEQKPQLRTELRLEVCAAQALLINVMTEAITHRPTLFLDDVRQTLAIRFEQFSAEPTNTGYTLLISTASTIAHRIYNALALEIAS